MPCMWMQWPQPWFRSLVSHKVPEHSQMSLLSTEPGKAPKYYQVCSKSHLSKKRSYQLHFKYLIVCVPGNEDLQTFPLLQKLPLHSTDLEKLWFPILWGGGGEKKQSKGGSFIVTVPNVQKKLENNPPTQFSPSPQHSLLPPTQIIPHPQTKKHKTGPGIPINSAAKKQFRENLTGFRLHPFCSLRDER